MRFAPLFASALAGSLFFSACDSNSDANRATIRFERAASSAALGKNADDGTLTLVGTNGTLTITDLRFVVSHFKLTSATACEEEDDDEREDDHNDKNGTAQTVVHDDDDDDCGEFESGPAFVDLPLGTGSATVATATDVPAGSYSELSFKVKDLNLDASDSDDDDEDDEAGGRAALQRVAQDVRAAFANWPRDASMVVVGTFQPTTGAARPFTAFVDAELKVRRPLNPPVTVDGATALTVEVDPKLWLLTGTGAVVDLSAYDYATTGRLLGLRSYLGNGFARIRHRGDD